MTKEATGTATCDEELKAKGRLKRKKGTEGVKEDLDHITKGVPKTKWTVHFDLTKSLRYQKLWQRLVGAVSYWPTFFKDRYSIRGDLRLIGILK